MHKFKHLLFGRAFPVFKTSFIAASSASLAFYLAKKNASMCQANLSDFVVNINGQSSVQYLLSQLRDKNSNTFQFRFFSDRIMRLLFEEALALEPKVVERRLSPTGAFYDHHKLRHKPEAYCAVTIIRAGDSMIGEVMNLLPGITIGKVLI